MTQAMIDQYNQHQQRIQLLRSTGDILLQRINILETHMNKRKQQNQYQFPKDINSLNTLVKRLLLMLAEIKTCQYFQLTFEPFSIFSSRYIEMCNRCHVSRACVLSESKHQSERETERASSETTEKEIEV